MLKESAPLYGSTARHSPPPHSKHQAILEEIIFKNWRNTEVQVSVNTGPGL